MAKCIGHIFDGRIGGNWRCERCGKTQEEVRAERKAEDEAKSVGAGMTNPADDAALIERMARAIHADCLGEGAWVDEPMPDKFREVAKAALDAARSALNAELSERIEEGERLREALTFYADPETYHACSFWFDPPTGGFDEDFDEDHGHEDYDRPMPGKRARAALSTPSRGGHDAG